MGNGSTDDGDYLRAAIVTSDHPGKPLDGTVVAMSSPHDISVDEPLFGTLIQQAEEQFDIDSYTSGLRLGTVYFDATSRATIGVLWEDSPLVYDHGDLEETVGVLPNELIRSDELL